MKHTLAFFLLFFTLASLDAQPRANDSLLNANYTAAIKKGDMYFESMMFTDAKSAYNLALTCKASDPYAASQILRSDQGIQQMEKQKALEAQYAAAIKEGDDAFVKQNYSASKTAYIKACTYKPAEQYPKDQIMKCDQKIKYGWETRVKPRMDSLQGLVHGLYDRKKYDSVMMVAKVILLQDIFRSSAISFEVNGSYKHSSVKLTDVLVAKGDSLLRDGDFYAPRFYYGFAYTLDLDNKGLQYRYNNINRIIDSMQYLSQYPVCEEWFNGPLKMMRNYTGYKTFSYKEYNIWGVLISEGFVKEGYPDSVCLRYHDSGEKMSEQHWKDKRMNGKFISWYKNGNVQQEFHYVNGKGAGKSHSYDQDGKIYMEFVFENGEEMSETKYFRNGNKSEYSELKGGKYIGKHIEYFENGNKKFETVYKEDGNYGKDVPVTYWYENGNKMKEITGKMKTTWYQNGVKEMEEDLSNGSKKCWTAEGKGTQCPFDEIQY
jgi:antitoxin component YwqK of YwqJK toxin-antitoxin module